MAPQRLVEPMEVKKEGKKEKKVKNDKHHKKGEEPAPMTPRPHGVPRWQMDNTCPSSSSSIPLPDVMRSLEDLQAWQLRVVSSRVLQILEAKQA